MPYKTILRQLAIKENKSEHQIEREMQQALIGAGLDCTVQEFVELTSFFINERRYRA